MSTDQLTLVYKGKFRWSPGKKETKLFRIFKLTKRYNSLLGVWFEQACFTVYCATKQITKRWFWIASYVPQATPRYWQLDLPVAKKRITAKTTLFRHNLDQAEYSSQSEQLYLDFLPVKRCFNVHKEGDSNWSLLMRFNLECLHKSRCAVAFTLLRVVI